MHTYFVPSELNVADDGTRGIDTRRDVLIHDDTRAALDKRAPLFPEHLLESRFMRGVPRGSARVPLTNAFETPEDMAEFLHKSLETLPSLNRDDKWAQVHVSGRARRISQGRRFDPPYRLLVLGDTRNRVPSCLKRTRSAVVDVRTFSDCLSLKRNILSKQYHGVIICPTTSSLYISTT